MKKYIAKIAKYFGAREQTITVYANDKRSAHNKASQQAFDKFGAGAVVLYVTDEIK